MDYHRDGNVRVDARYEKEVWRANYRYARSTYDDRHHLGLYYTPNERTHMSVTQDGDNTSSYTRFHLSDRLSHDLQYQSHNDYWRYHASYRHLQSRFNSNYQYSVDPHKHHLSSSLRLTDRTTLQSGVYVGHSGNSTHDNKRAFGIESSLQHRLSNHQSLSVGASWHNLTKKDNVALQFYWQHRTKKGIDIGASYRHGGNAWRGSYENRIGKVDLSDTKRSEGEWFLRIGLNAYKPPASLPKLGRYVASGNAGGQAVITLLHDYEDFKITPDEPMFFNVNNKLTSANLLSSTNKKSTYLIDLPKGVYEIELDGRNIPIEYALPNKAVAKIDARLPTHIQWQMTQSYGIRGRISVGGEQVQAWKDDKIMTHTKTDKNGYFLLDGLPKGKYIIRADGHTPKQVVVVDDYVLGVVLDAASTEARYR
ncbi:MULTISPECIES: hypothetical protein [unclassified Moraxella]|uniref:carboxypeptidase-like regulatory domain-containing protein n=1 Tax=unclassified Moraxella TaxID=2685852 RepID=UPI00359EE6FE